MAKKFSAISAAKAAGMDRVKSYSSPFATKWNDYRVSAEFYATPEQLKAFMAVLAAEGIVESAPKTGQYDLPDGKWVLIRDTNVQVRSPKAAATYTGSLYD